MPPSAPHVIAVDPGREKCGLAVATAEAVLFRALIPTAEVGLTCRYLLGQYPGARLLLGDATGSAAVRAALLASSPEAAIDRQGAGGGSADLGPAATRLARSGGAPGAFAAGQTNC